MEDVTKRKLDEDQIKELNIILSLIDKYKIETDIESRNQLIRMIAVRHVITKGYLVKEVSCMIVDEDLKFIKMIDDKLKALLTPIYNGLVDMATNHCKEWFLALMRKSGSTNPKMYKFQQKLIKWLFTAIIHNELTDSIYSLLISRGSGKTHSLSVGGFFLMLFHNRYILHNNFPDFVQIATAPQQEQLTSFQRYYHNFCELCTTNNSEIGLIGSNEKDESLLGVYIKYKSMNRIELARQNGGVFSVIYFCLGAESIESKHTNLLLSDETKFINSRKVLYGSMLPTCGSRNGVFLALSSASHDYCIFQELCEKNKIEDIEDLNNGYDKIEYTTWDGSNFDKNRPDNTKSFTGRRHFEQHWEDMVFEYNSYALTVSRAMANGRDDPEFSVMYDNKFLSKKTSTFFDIKILRDNYKHIFIDDNIQKYLDNPAYTLTGGWDIAVTGDNSILTIKAYEGSIGVNRRSKVIALFMLNPRKDKNSDSVYNQCKSVVELIKQYKLVGLVIDGSGVGKSSSVYIHDILREERYYRIQAKDVVEIVITSGNKTNLLENYHNRIQNGMESFFNVPQSWENEDYLKPLYINSLKLVSEDALKILFIYEHVKFCRTIVKNEKDDSTKIVFAQAQLSWIHDDFVNSSSLCNEILNINPSICNIGFEKPDIGFNNGIYNRNF